MSTIILCLGVMNGVAGANNAIKAMARALAIGVEKKLMRMALTKGVLYPVIKSILKWFGVNLTKALFAGSVKKAIPIVGGVIGGGITFAMFKPCCEELKDALKDTLLSNPNHVPNQEEKNITDALAKGVFIDAEFIEDNNP